MKILYILLFVASSFSSAQEPLKFEKIIEANDTKEILFPIIKEWIATKFVSANDVIQMEDPTSGIFVVKGKSSYSHPKALYSCYNGAIEFTLKIEVRDGKYRVQLFDLKHITNANNKCELGVLTSAEIHSTKGLNKRYNNNVWAILKEEASSLANRVFIGLEQATAQGANDNDW